MTRQLKGVRYATGASPAFVKILTERLPYFSFPEAMRFYADYVHRLKPTELALLGCNDRFFLLTSLLNRVDAIHPWLYDRAREVENDPDGFLDLWSRFHYKDLAVDTPVLTPNGWVDHGDLQPGDCVYGPNGVAVQVLATRHFTDSACYKVAFCNGVEIVAGAGHLWTVNIKTSKRVPGTYKAGVSNGQRIGRETRTVTTVELRKLLRNKPGIVIADPIDGPDIELPVEPYLFGAWLGDGFSESGSVCGVDIGVFQEIERRGSMLHPKRRINHDNPAYRVHGVKELHTTLRNAGLLKNKHIPETYLLASRAQRQALLQGLVDTDGSVSTAEKNACVTFASSNENLAQQVQTLAISLGYKARLTPARTTNSWHVTFIAYEDDPEPPCLLERKRALLKTKSENHHKFPQSKTWYVKSIEETETVPTNCIQVDSEDGLYLAGKQLVPTHNSTIITFAGIIQEILCDPDICVAIFSNNIKIARPFLGQIQEELQANEALKGLYPDVLWANPKLEAPTWSLDKGLVVKRKSTNRKECTVEAHGLIDAMPTGKHFPLQVYDDVITEKNVTNPDQIKKASERIELSFPLGVGEKTRRWWIGTRYHYADTYGHLLNRETAQPRIYPATHDGTIDGNPVFMTPEAWADAKRDMRSQIAAQMLQNPIAGQENMFFVKWLKPYYVRPVLMNVYILCDPSKGRNKTSDRTAIAVVGIDAQNNKYLLDGYCHRMGLSERWDKLKALYKKWSSIAATRLLSVGYERYGMQSDIEYFEEKMREKGPSFTITEVNWTGERGRESKEHRVERLEPDFRHSSFFVPSKVWTPSVEGHVAEWHVEEGTDEFVYMPYRENIQEKRCRAHGELWRLMDPIKRLDEDGNIYDLTRVFFEEFRFFPFSPRDDLIDAMSRIYDLEPAAPVLHERVPVMDYPDA